MSTLQLTTPIASAEASLLALTRAAREKNAMYAFCLDAARQMDASGLHVAAHALEFTAAQEAEHLQVLQGLLIRLGGEMPSAAEDEASALPDDPLACLAEAARRERAIQCMHPVWADMAGSAGEPLIEAAFRRMARIDRTHEQRFRQYEQMLRDGTLLRDTERVSWVCLHCGQMAAGQTAPACCSGCHGGRGGFIRSSFAPFAVQEE